MNGTGGEDTQPTANAGSGDLAPGTVLNRTHRIDALLAQGGMGRVYRATNLATGEPAAIKVMRPEFFDDERLKTLFLREGAALRKLRDPAIVYYEGTFLGEGGQLYLVMELVDGPSLAAAARGRPLAPAEVRQLRDRLLAGLAAAHEIGLVHRDVSPDNVILPGGRLDEAKLIDFGIAKHLAGPQTTVIGSGFAGKVAYAAPEQFGLFGGVIDARTDVYSLGLVLAYAATGKPLDMGATAPAVLAARHRVPDLTAVPAALRDELARMLEPNPADRMSALPPSTRSAAAAPARPRGLAGLLRGRAGAIAAAAAVAVLAGGTWLALRAPSSPTIAPHTDPGVAIPPALDVPSAGASGASVARERRPVMQIAGAYPAAGAVFRDRHADGGPCGDCPEMVIVPAGSFTMGATLEEEEREQVPREWSRRAQPLTGVEIGQAFALGRTHVTFAQYAAFVAATGRPDAPGCAWRTPGFQAHDDDPVVCVSFDDAQDYARWLSEHTAYTYRLPSEAEWEYAARAGTSTARWWGEAIGRGNANCYDCGSRWDNQSTAPVMSFPPNAFGLYDMLGNAWQFTADCWNETLAGRPRAERAVMTGNCNGRPVRGGAWDSGPASVRAGHRDWSGAGNRDNDTGFRVLRVLPEGR